MSAWLTVYPFCSALGLRLSSGQSCNQNEETYEMMGSSALQCMAVRMGEPTALGGAAVRGCGGQLTGVTGK